MSTKSFGTLLKEYREAHDMSQQELADILGTTKQVISRYETGQRDPKITIAQEYARILDLPLSYFLEGTISSNNHAPQPSESKHNIIKIAARDGTFIEKHLSDEDLAALSVLLDRLPDASDNL